MLKINHYKRPYSAVVIGGEKLRVTPGVISKFINPISKKNINIYGLATGENSFSIYISEDDFERTMEILMKVPIQHSDISARKGLGMVSIKGPEVIDMPGLLHSLLEPIAKEKINIEGISSSYDSIMLFFEFSKSKRAYELICEKVEKMPNFFEKK
jgi:aspartate kinase